jgi:hypothetical protein
MARIGNAAMKNEDTLVLSSGREVYVHLGIIGLGPTLKVYNGYDSPIYLAEDDDSWSPLERQELALLMIRRWITFYHQSSQHDHDA